MEIEKKKFAWGLLTLMCGLVTPVLYILMYFDHGILLWTDVALGLVFGVIAFKEKTQRLLAAVGVLPLLFIVLFATGVFGYSGH